MAQTHSSVPEPLSTYFHHSSRMPLPSLILCLFRLFPRALSFFKEMEQLSTMLITPSKASTGERLSLAHFWRVSLTHQSWRWQSNMLVLILCLLGSGRHSTNFLKVSRSYFVVRAELVHFIWRIRLTFDVLWYSSSSLLTLHLVLLFDHLCWIKLS